MKLNSPEEEAKLLPISNDIDSYRFIRQKVLAYSQYRVGDVLVDTDTKYKYMVTYIDPEFNLIYGRRILRRGGLSQRRHHITGMFATFELDKDQVNAMLLGTEYKPWSRNETK